MSTSVIEAPVALEPPAELVSFVERQVRNARTYAGVERRSDKRYLMAIPVLVRPVDEQSNAVGVPFAAMTRDISPRGIGLAHTEPIEQGLLALRMTLAGEEVNLVAEVQWCKGLGPFYYVGAKFVSRLEDSRKS